jgi:CBS domain-containing protein
MDDDVASFRGARMTTSRLGQELELDRQKRLLEDTLGRTPLMNDTPVEKFNRDVFKSFESVRNVLQSVTLEDYLASYDESEATAPLMFDETMTLEQVLIRMREFNISSAPVLETKGSAKRFVGWHSLSDCLNDIVGEVLAVAPPDAEIIRETACLSGIPHVHSAWGVLARHVRTVTSSERLVGEGIEEREIALDTAIRAWLESITNDDISTAVTNAMSRTLRESRASTYSDEDGRMTNRVTARDTDLLEVVRSAFLRHIVTAGDMIAPRQARACHRMCVYEMKPDPDDDMKDKMVIESLISMSDIVQFLYEQSEGFDETLKRRNLASIALGAQHHHRVFPDSDVVCTLPTTRTLDAFMTMHITGRSVLGIIDEPRGKLVDVLSISDIRECVFDVKNLTGSVEEFLSRRKRKHLVVVHEDSDFIDALAALCNSGIHHLFVVDLSGSPLRVITPTDILSRITLPSSHRVGWRFDSYEIHPDTFGKTTTSA